MLGLRLDGGAEDAARLAALAECWASFEGHHPFHNYTKRRLYRNDAQGPGLGGRGDERRRKHGRRWVRGDVRVGWAQKGGMRVAGRLPRARCALVQVARCS